MLELTDRAQAAVSGFLAQASGRFTGLRIGVRDVSCSGVTYSLALIEAAEEDDITLNCGDVPVFVDSRSARLLEGCEVDFISENGGGFKIANPNVQTCASGCPSAGTCGI